MCGIVGVASPGPMSVQMKEFFQSLLFHDVVRGHHATGVAAVDTLDRSLTVEKKAIPAPVFLANEEIMDNLFHYKHNFNIYIGHNRWATSGTKDADMNAHPFIHSDVVGVHNGSLRNQRLLDDHKDFVVDSDNLFFHLNKNGLEDTVKKTDGAYALCWYDKRDNTLNFIHNGERPLALGKLTNGCYVWASEFGMLTWLVRRHKSLAFDTYMEDGVKMQNVYNVAKNKHVKIAFKDKTRQFDGDMEVTEYTPPTFPSVNWTNDDYYSSNRRSNWGNSNNPATRSGARGPIVTEAEKKATAAIDMFLAGAKTHESILEVKFLGNVKSKVPNGTYIGELALWEYRSKNGMIIKLHSFVYNNSFTTGWGDDKIGTFAYVAMGSVSEHNNSTYIEARNENIGHTISAIKHTVIKPNRLFPYHEEGAADSKVVPFRGRETPQQAGQTSTPSTTEQSQHGATSDVQRRVDDLEQAAAERRTAALLDKPEGMSKFMSMKVQLANGFTTQGDFIEMMSENHHACADCGKKMTEMVSSRIYLFEHFDRQEGKTYNYLTCRKICDEDMREVCAEIDKDYDKLYGGNDA